MVLSAFGAVTYCSAMLDARCTRSAMLSDGSLVSATIFDRKASLKGAPRAAEIAAVRTAFSAATVSSSVPDFAFAITDIENEFGRDAPNTSIL